MSPGELVMTARGQGFDFELIEGRVFVRWRRDRGSALEALQLGEPPATLLEELRDRREDVRAWLEAEAAERASLDRLLRFKRALPEEMASNFGDWSLKDPVIAARNEGLPENLKAALLEYERQSMLRAARKLVELLSRDEG